MKKYLVIYHAPASAMAKMSTASKEEKEAGMKAWMDWKASVGDAVLDFGAPLMPATHIAADGSTSQSTNEVTGYSLIQAESQAAAVEMLKRHPHLAWVEGVAIEVSECIPMG